MGTKRRNWTTVQGQWDKDWKYNSFLLSRMDQGRIKSFSYKTEFFFSDRKAFLNGFAHHPYMGPLAPFMPMNPVNIMTPPVSLAMATHLGLRHEGSIIKDRSDSDLISPR